MPIYDFLCIKCDYEFEGISSVKEKDDMLCSKCKGDTKTLITQSGFQFYEEFDIHLGRKITGPAQKRKIMKERGLEEIHKCESHRIDKSVTKKKRETIHDVVDRIHKKGNFNPVWNKYL